MTGHQEHPGTGTTLMGEPSETASIQKVAEAFGFKHVYTVDPYNLRDTSEALDAALSTDEPALVVSSRACPLRDRVRAGDTRRILAEDCKQCKACLRIGCPAIEATDGAPVINEYLCIGCGLCEQVCKFDAIRVLQRSEV
jgi:indolepyruvate ferredoxin oxidoreductase alpha subunit